MSYTVLARKWRPKSFSELVGQSHVMQALSNALDQQRLHHAYLFTGTRGVGKTTIARIFAKALNCQEGVGSQPCGVCETCRSIDEGRFIDLIEVDAASKTKVDDTREILDNVQFAPTQGRYKVYLIDEVHMLSKSSFNALLKTLEEPPEHVKFLLATTDPHKLPITVLSRCLQFNLMRLTQTQIQTHLAHILSQEQIAYEDSALALIAKSADGSARDSLSLLDQAIAYSAGEVMFEPVQTMLGLVDQQFGVAILQALANDDVQSLKEIIQNLAVMGVDYQALLSQLIESLHAIAYAQLFSEQETTTLLPAEIVQGFAQSFSPERVQMLYQIALLAKQDMQLAPDIRIGFEMSLMRMLAFIPSELAAKDDSSSSRAIHGGEKISTPVTSSANNSIPSSQGEMSPADAMASLASARSLVGKKNTEISQTNPSTEITSSQSTFEPNIEPETTSSNISAQEPSPPSFFEQSNEHDSYSNSPVESSENVNALRANTEPFHDAEPASQTLADDALTREQSANDERAKDKPKLEHLAMIKAKLKQPFALKKEPKSEESVEKSSSTTAETQSNSGQEPLSVNSNSSTPLQESNPLLTGTEEIEQVALNNQTPPSVLQTQQPMNRHVVAPVNQNPSAGTQAAQAPQSSPVLERSAQIEVEPSANDLTMEAPPWLVDDQEPMQNQMGVEDVSLPPEPISNRALYSDSEPVGGNDTRSSSHADFQRSDNALEDWKQLIHAIGLKGMAEELARNSVLVELSGEKVAISIDPEQMFAKPEMALEQISTALKNYLNTQVELVLVDAKEHYTPAKEAQANQQNKIQAAQESIAQDPVIEQFKNILGMEVIPSSVKPV